MDLIPSMESNKPLTKHSMCIQITMMNEVWQRTLLSSKCWESFTLDTFKERSKSEHFSVNLINSFLFVLVVTWHLSCSLCFHFVAIHGAWSQSELHGHDSRHQHFSTCYIYQHNVSFCNKVHKVHQQHSKTKVAWKMSLNVWTPWWCKQSKSKD